MDNAISIVPIKFRDVPRGETVVGSDHLPDSVVYRIQHGDVVHYRCINGGIGDLVDYLLENDDVARSLCG